MYKILIVEDDEVIGRTVQNHLREWGYEAACEGFEACAGRICGLRTASRPDGHPAAIL